MTGISALLTETPREPLSPLPPCEDAAKSVTWKMAVTWPCWPPDLGFPGPRMASEISGVYKPPSLEHLVTDSSLHGLTRPSSMSLSSLIALIVRRPVTRFVFLVVLVVASQLDRKCHEGRVFLSVPHRHVSVVPGTVPALQQVLNKYETNEYVSQAQLF